VHEEMLKDPLNGLYNPALQFLHSVCEMANVPGWHDKHHACPVFGEIVPGMHGWQVT
jgi:hypothetical protein